MLNLYRRILILILILVAHQISIDSSYVRHLSFLNDINRLTYSSSIGWLYVASIDSLSIYDENLTLVQHVIIQNSSRQNFDPCSINPCQCLRKSSVSLQTDSTTTRSQLGEKNLNQDDPSSSFVNRNNYNLILYLENEEKINNQSYLIDCWSLQPGSCIVRNALNISEIYDQQKTDEKIQQTHRVLFNSEPSAPNHLFPFRLKLKKCRNSPIYLFLTSTLKRNFHSSSDQENHFHNLQCFEQAQKRTIALRVFVHDDKQSNVSAHSISRESTAERDRSSSREHFRQNRSSTIYVQERTSFPNINDYCPEQFSVLRSIYTDFFERESSEKFRRFQDVIFDQNDSTTYLFTNQQNQSKIVRLCQGPISFRHYVELPIGCGREYTLVQKVNLIKQNNGQDYLLLIASKPNGTGSLEPLHNRQSALCLYEFDRIRQAFVESIHDLAKGNVSLGMAWLHGESVIPQYSAPYGNLARCSSTRDASYLMIYEGTSNIRTQTLIEFPTDQLISLQAISIDNGFVVFLATADGKIKKVHVEPKEKFAFQFDEIFVHYGEQILRDLILSQNGRFLYGATKNRLFQVDLHDCDQHKTCFSCLATKNPFCQWRTDENRCRVRSSSENTILKFSSLRIDENCPNILEIRPNTISKTRSNQLEILVENLIEDPNSPYFCTFSVSSFSIDGHHDENQTSLHKSNAQRINSLIRCPSPSNEVLSNLERDSFFLHVFYKNLHVAEKRIDFYDCSSYKTCSDCLRNNFNCAWNLLTAECLDEEFREDFNSTIGEIFLLKENPICPRFRVSAEEIFIPNGEIVELGGSNSIGILPIDLQLNVQKYFRCVLMRFNSTPIIANARVNNDSIICDRLRVFYDEQIGQGTFQLAIEWAECSDHCIYKNLETTQNFTVNIYKCDLLADSCGSCVLLENDFRCSWCESDKSCRHERNSSFCESTQIVNSSIGICPNPRIFQIWPKIVAENGETPLRIEGSNLGRTSTEISTVLINSNGTEFPCSVRAETYVVSQSFTCDSPALAKGSYSIRVTVLSAKSQDELNFRVEKPTIRQISPILGPLSGGTLLTIRGTNLRIGSETKIFIGDQRCFLLDEQPIVGKSNSEKIFCRTSKFFNSSSFIEENGFFSGKITIRIDNFTETYPNISFSYGQDPKVFELSRYGGIESGGLNFVARGIHFDSIETPRFFLEFDQNQIFIENCSVKSSEMIFCRGPKLNNFLRDFLSSNFSTSLRSGEKTRCVNVKFAFLMDNVEPVRNTSNFAEPFLVCLDPIINSFNNDGKRIQYRFDYLTIEGSNLLDVATIEDYSVTIGSYPCRITSISDKQIVCQPMNHSLEILSRRKRSLLDLNSIENDPTTVRVTLGHRVYLVGSLIYIFNVERRSLALYYIIASVCGLFLTLFIIIISILFRRVNHKRARQLHRLQTQIDSLEMRVARECKEAFAELQTDIGEITNDLSHSGVPYHDYRTYCMKILFTNYTEDEKYMMLHDVDIVVDTNRQKSIRQGLQLLSHSLQNPNFLLTIIRTLENDKIHFRLQDRMQFASLISVLLQNNIDYFTEILKILLRDLIEKSLQQDRNNSKILLRSNAAVAEKMLSNWFAFLLYGYIKDCFGSSFYILFQSIKQQIQKGPIDCITNESRYSLSEDKLLRQHVDYSSMIIYVIQVEHEKSFLQSMPVPIKVLTCDSINQVKEKVVDQFYKNVPFSCRPTIDDFDLECRFGSQIKLLRDDEQIDSPDSNGFVQIQTLAHYKIHDGARLFLKLKTEPIVCGSISSISSQTTSVSPSNIFPHCYSSNNSSCLKRSEIDQRWQNSSSNENQILLNSNNDSLTKRKDLRSEEQKKFYHLVKPSNRDDDDRCLVTNKLVSEVYLTRLLATKGSLQQYIDTFFDRVFSLVNLPAPIKYLFDFLDDQANIHQLFDSQIVHTWKNNSLPLRFFVNIIKNPDFIFDVQKTNGIDACLSVIAQMFMDSCASGTHQLTKDSPSSKLLFYRDVQKYKKLVEKYYETISLMPPVPTSELHRSMASVIHHEEQNSDNKQSTGFNRDYALFKLYTDFIGRYKTSLRMAMASDLNSKQYRLVALFDQITNLMEGFELDI